MALYEGESASAHDLTNTSKKRAIARISIPAMAGISVGNRESRSGLRPGLEIESEETLARITGSGLDAAPLGPGSLTWKYFGDMRGNLLALRAGVLQGMHPAIAAGLTDHSDFFENPLGRLARSAGPIVGVVYDRDPAATGSWVRDQHPEIRGTDARGRSYHALDPDTYYWAHATFFEGMIRTREFFDRPLTRAEKEHLYRESITWYARYGVSMRPVPEDYSAFERYWQRMFDEVLEPTRPAGEWVRRVQGIPAPPAWPDLAWRPVGPLVGIAGPWLTRVTLPEAARQMFGCEISRRDRLAFDAFRKSVRATWRLVPGRFRMQPRVGAAAGADS